MWNRKALDIAQMSKTNPTLLITIFNVTEQCCMKHTFVTG